MKLKMIELGKLDELLEEYKKFKNKGESFSEFIEVSGCIEENKPKVFDWVYVEEGNIEEVKEE